MSRWDLAYLLIASALIVAISIVAIVMILEGWTLPAPRQ